MAPDWIIESQLGRSISYSLPDAAGEGRIEFFHLASDIRVIIFDCHWRQARSFRVHDGDWIRFNFSLSIDMAMQFADIFTVQANQPGWRIIKNADTTEVLRGGEKSVWVTVCCKQEMLTRLSDIAADDLPHPLRPPAADEKVRGLHAPYDITERLNAITLDILHNGMTGGLRLAFVEARAVELICLALDHVLNPTASVIPVKLSASDLTALDTAHRILLRQYSDPPSVKALSREIGINRNKLYYGFKSVYGMSLMDFIQEQRLLEGARLLRTTDLSVTEIAAQVGFRHQCNFSTAVRRHFGVSPKQMRDQARATDPHPRPARITD